MSSLVCLVDTDGNVIGSSDKLEAHQPAGRLHLAFSVFIRDSAGRHLLQRRASTKYHFAERWANTCCSHPAPGENVASAAVRRLSQEMGIGAQLETCGTFIYRAIDPLGGLIEHELDHVLLGYFDGDPSPDADEVDDWQWITPEALRTWIEQRPSELAPWLIEAVNHFPGLLR